MVPNTNQRPWAPSLESMLDTIPSLINILSKSSTMPSRLLDIVILINYTQIETHNQCTPILAEEIFSQILQEKEV